MRITASKTVGSADALLLPFFAASAPAFSSKGLSGLYRHILKTDDFSGDHGQVLVLYPTKGDHKRVVLFGLGKKKDLSSEKVRQAYAMAVNAIKCHGGKVCVHMPTDPTLHSAGIEGAYLASYVFDDYLQNAKKRIRHLLFSGADKKELSQVETVCKSVFFVRDLVMGNADDVTPHFLAETAKELAKADRKLKAKVLGPKEIEREGLGLIQAVSRAASIPPALIILEYQGAPKEKKQTALVGKGITYDTGGLTLKPTSGMITMRDDMSGAGAVLGAMRAISELALPVNIVAVIPATENCIGSKSFKLGDVYPSHKGVTVEITNTDAEGRLVLADAISYVQTHYQPERIIDLATLTGGVIIAFGEERAGFVANDDTLAKDLFRAGEETYERLWQMPFDEEYKDLLKSDIADIKNSGIRQASSIQGGVFIERFVDKCKWAHLDVAGVTFPDKRKAYQPVQATGVGVRLLVEYFRGQVS